MAAHRQRNPAPPARGGQLAHAPPDGHAGRPARDCSRVRCQHPARHRAARQDLRRRSPHHGRTQCLCGPLPAVAHLPAAAHRAARGCHAGRVLPWCSGAPHHHRRRHAPGAAGLPGARRRRNPTADHPARAAHHRAHRNERDGNPPARPGRRRGLLWTPGAVAGAQHGRSAHVPPAAGHHVPRRARGCAPRGRVPRPGPAGRAL